MCAYVYIYMYENALYSKTPLFKNGKIPRGSYYRSNSLGGGEKKIIMDSMEGEDKQDFIFLSAFQFSCVAAPFYLEYIIMAEIKVKFIYSEEVK